MTRRYIEDHRSYHAAYMRRYRKTAKYQEWYRRKRAENTAYNLQWRRDRREFGKRT